MLTIHGLTDWLQEADSSDDNPLIIWLRGGQELGQPLLHVQLVGLDDSEMIHCMEAFYAIYNALQECCTLELVGISFLHYRWRSVVRLSLQ